MFHRVKKGAVALVAIAALAVGAAAIGSAATPQGTTSSVSPPPDMPAHGSAAHEDAEKPVTGDAAAKAKAAALASVGSGTAGEVTTDYTQNGYEVTVTKSDGSSVEVHLDSSFNVMQVPGPGGFGQ
jgi:hypothetical protein